MLNRKMSPAGEAEQPPTVEVAVFDRVVDIEDHGPIRIFRCEALRTWKDENGCHSSTARLQPEDMLPLALFLQLAFEFIANEQAKK